MNLLSFSKVGLGLTLILAGNLANAYIVSVDSFGMEVNGTQVVNEGFNGSLTSAQNLNFPIGFADGRGLIDSRSTPLGTSAISGNSRYFQRARNSYNLYETDSFLVSSVFDIVGPDGDYARYGIRLTDQCGTCNNDDIVDIGLRFDRGSTDVAYRYNNDVRNPALANGFDFSQSTGDISVDTFSQIALFLRNDGDGIIDAGFLFLDGLTNFDVASMYSTINWFDTGYNIFNGESRVRAEFYNTEVIYPATNVPEPSAAILFGTSLLAFGFLRRRREKLVA